ncbi:hypothetical protein AALC17_16875, partial [Oscillospiraceae bacterium 38-13]
TSWRNLAPALVYFVAKFGPFYLTAYSCDTENCPHQNERSNPLWWLVQTAKGEQDTRRTSWAWRDGKLELEPGMIVPLQDKDRHADGTCNEFNVYLNGKGPDGKVLRNIKRVIMPA